MSRFDKDLKVGDIVTASSKGYWRIEDIKRNFVTQEQAEMWPSLYTTTKIGNETTSTVRLRQVLSANQNALRGKDPCCYMESADSCMVVTPAWVDAEAKKAADGWARLKALI